MEDNKHIIDKCMEIFPRALILDEITLDWISKNIFGFEKESINLEDEEELFTLIKDMSSKALSIAVKPFFTDSICNADKVMKAYHYDIDSMMVTIVFSVIHSLFDQFTSTSKSSVVKEYSTYEPEFANSDDRAIVKRVSSLNSLNRERNEQHLDYMNSTQHFEMVLKQSDVIYYRFLNLHPYIKKFLHINDIPANEKLNNNNVPVDKKLNNNNIPVNKKLIEEFTKAYKDIDEEFGFNKFKLTYLLERDSQIDIMTHMTNSLNNLFNKKKINKCIIDEQLERIASLCYYKAFDNTLFKYLKLVAQNDSSITVVYLQYFQWMEELYKDRNTKYTTINNIVLGMYDIYNFYENNYNSIKTISNNIIFLNTILYAAYSIVADTISSILIYSKLDNFNHYSYTSLKA